MQLLSLNQIELFGWQLHFVRKPLFKNMLPVIISADGQSIGVLEEDGRINLQAELSRRN